jgi:hypothetical protein
VPPLVTVAVIVDDAHDRELERTLASIRGQTAAGDVVVLDPQPALTASVWHGLSSAVTPLVAVVRAGVVWDPVLVERLAPSATAAAAAFSDVWVLSGDRRDPAASRSWSARTHRDELTPGPLAAGLPERVAMAAGHATLPVTAAALIDRAVAARLDVPAAVDDVERWLVDGLAGTADALWFVGERLADVPARLTVAERAAPHSITAAMVLERHQRRPEIDEIHRRWAEYAWELARQASTARGRRWEVLRRATEAEPYLAGWRRVAAWVLARSLVAGRIAGWLAPRFADRHQRHAAGCVTRGAGPGRRRSW